jgi:hypothetical protein
VKDIVAVDRRPREQGEPRHERREAAEYHRPRPEAHDQAVGVADREDPHQDRDWQERETSLEGVVVEDPLQVQSTEEEHPEHPRDAQHLDQVRPRNVARAEDSQRYKRAARGRLASDEGRQQH